MLGSDSKKSGIKSSKSLKRTIILFISIAAILPIIIFGVATASISSGILKNLIQNKNIQLTKVLISRVEEYLSHPFEDLSNIKFYLQNNRHDLAKAGSYLNRMIKIHKLYAALQIADKNGLVTHVAPYDEEVIGSDVSSKSYFIAIQKKNEIFWSEALISPRFNHPVVSMSVPLNHGVLTGYISLQNLTESIKNLELGQGSFVSITDQTATYIAHYDYSKVRERAHDPHYDLFKSSYNGDIMTRIVDYNGVEMICHVSFIRPMNWTVSIYQSKKEVLAPIRQLYQIVVVGVIFILIVAILLSMRFARSINSAIVKIMSYTSRVSAGCYDVTDDDLDYVEFAQLRHNFKIMANNVKAREDRIKESENTFRAIFESGAIGGSIIDTDGNFINFNKRWLDITGFQEKELKTMRYFDLVDSIDRGKMRQMINEMLDTKTDIGCIEARLLKNNGNIIWIEQHSSVVRKEDKQPFIINIAIDVTDRKKSDLARSRLVSVIEQTDEHIMVTNVDGNIEYVNPAFERITGYAKDEALGKNPRFLKSGFHNDQYYTELWETITGGNVWKGRLTNFNKQGVVFEEFATIFPVTNDEGVISNFVGIKRDITKQLMVEDQLRQSQKMEAIGTLAGGIAHDFNNIISALSGYAKLAKDRLNDQTKARYYLDQIDKATHRAGELVGQILTFSRKSVQKKSPMLLHPIVKEAVKFIRSSIPSNIEVRQNIEESGYVSADPTQVYQIVMNLCTNAYQSMQEQESGGVLLVSLKEVQLEVTDVNPRWEIKPGKFMKLTVSDTGNGFSDAIKEKIFEPYFTTKEKGDGTGLGLAMVDGIVSGYGGCIEVKSTPGEGSEFSIYLPISNIGKHKKLEILNPDEIKGGSEHLIVVDDEEQLVNIIDDSLKSYGYQVSCFSDSRKAYEQFMKNPKHFDILITDLIMPAFTGIELIKKIRIINPNLPAILCSGHTLTMNSKKAARKGINAYLEKPFQLDRLAQVVRSVLDEFKQRS